MPLCAIAHPLHTGFAKSIGIGIGYILGGVSIGAHFETASCLGSLVRLHVPGLSSEVMVVVVEFDRTLGEPRRARHGGGRVSAGGGHGANRGLAGGGGAGRAGGRALRAAAGPGAACRQLSHVLRPGRSQGVGVCRIVVSEREAPKLSVDLV